jgi:hypothetical protein
MPQCRSPPRRGQLVAIRAMSVAAPSQAVSAKASSASPSGRSAVLQRKCSCGASKGSAEETCDDCRARSLQRRLAVGASGHPLEQEADRVADQVVTMSMRSPLSTAPPRVQRLAAQPDGVVEAAAPASVDATLAAPGLPLDTALRRDMEWRFGHDFSRVRVHTDAVAEVSARDASASAYTVGHDIVFGEGQYRPASTRGRRLLAHELTHVVQQEAYATTRVQREPKPEGRAGKKAAPRAAAPVPKLELTPSKIEPPCACLMVVHNDERNARKTAQLMHANCAYNLALISPDTSSRLIKIPGQKGSVDPNSLFPREIAEKCLNDEPSCRDFVAKKAGTTDKDKIEQFVQIQFFLTVSDCAKGFSLPVVALHNNDVEDTKNYLKEKDKKGVSDLKLDVDKSKKETGADQVTKLKDLIKKKFGESVETEMIETAGKTNIFRWCASNDLSRCHIGDPDHPDNVTWVTNEKDFAALSKKDLNVALQSEAPTSKTSESEGDLSTLFLLLKDILNVRLTKVLESLERKQQADWMEIDKIFEQIEKMREFHDATALDVLGKLIEILRLLIDIPSSKIGAFLAPAGTRAHIEKLRYINIETPGKRLSDQSGAERVRNYEAIVEVLKTTGLHCCGDDPKKAEQTIKEGLKES